MVRANNKNGSDELAEVLLNERKYIETLLTVKTKKAKMVPFKLSPIQLRVSREETRRNIKLKPRQVGMSTYELGKRFARFCTRLNWTVVTVAHDAPTTELLLQTVHQFYKNLPPELQPRTQYANRSEIYFPELNNRWVIFTAGSNNGPGRGTTINDIHGSEVAYWPNPKDILGGLLETAPKDAYVDLESTANGAGGFFHQHYNEAKHGLNGFKAFFFPWWWQPEYRISNAEAPSFGVDPFSTYEEDEQRLVDRYNLDRQQLNWRRWKRSVVKELFEQEYPEDDETCFLTSGRTYFDKEAVKRAKLVGEYAPVETRDSGDLLIWKRPLPGQTYLIGADVAEGLADGDYDAVIVLDETGDEVATLRGHWNPHIFAQKLKDLSEEYNEALVVVERNNHGHAVLTTLIYELAYKHRVYHHQDYDQRGKLVKKPGWITSSKTKPIMLSTLQQVLESGPELFHNAAFFGECSTFVYHDDGSIGSINGCHDDLVMARAIGQEALKSHRPGKTMHVYNLLADDDEDETVEENEE
jgi:hypothetical protein